MKLGVLNVGIYSILGIIMHGWAVDRTYMFNM